MKGTPVELADWKNSFHHTPVLTDRGLGFLMNHSGSYRVRWGRQVLEGQGSIAFLARGPGEMALSGSGSARFLSCDFSLLNNIFHTGYGSRLSVFLSPLELSFLCFRPRGEDLLFLDTVYTRLREEVKENRRDRDQIMEFHILELLLYLRSLRPLSSSEIKNITPSSDVWTMDEVVQFIKQNYDGTYTLDDLASRCALNSSYFSRAFKEHRGIPLFEFINRLRIEKACQLLKTSDLTILEIALSVGYNNVSFFNRYFKRIHLISPGEYRRRIRK